MWKISYLSGGGKWHDCGTCEAKLTEKTLTLSNIDSDRIRPKTQGGKVSCKRDWCKEVTDEDFKKGEFYWYYMKAGIPHRFERIA